MTDAENLLKAQFWLKEYYTPVKESCAAEKVQAQEHYKERVAELERQHKEILSGLKEQKEIKDENYVYKNRLSNAKLELQKEYQAIKDEKHEAFSYKYHLIDMLRLSKFTFFRDQRAEMGKLQITNLIPVLSSYRMDCILQLS